MPFLLASSAADYDLSWAWRDSKSMNESDTGEPPGTIMTHPALDPRLGVDCAYGDPVTWREALELLYELLPEYADNLSASLKAGDTTRMHSVAHGLSGASSYCGTVAVHVSAKQLEALCLRENAGSLHEAVSAVLHNIDRLVHIRQSGMLPPADGEPVY